jgi:hypothetical protein
MLDCKSQIVERKSGGPAHGTDNRPQHLSVQESRPEWRKRQARPHELDDATKPTGEPRSLAPRHLFGLFGYAFFSLGVG